MNKFLLAGWATLLLSMGGNAIAQIGVKEPPPSKKIEGPSLADTLQWLTQKVASSGADNPKDRYTYKLEFNGCTMTSMQERQLVIDDDGRNERWVSRSDLQSLDPRWFNPEASWQKNSRGGSAITLRWSTLGGRQSIKVVTATRNRAERKPMPSWESLVQQLEAKPEFVDKTSFFYLVDEDAAERIQAAMKHAIALCQQKAAEEKAAEPPKPKELF